MAQKSGAGELARRRISASRPDFLAYKTSCPFCGQEVGPRFVTREHADVPPNPPYAAGVRCPRCRETYEVLFTGP
ncbi:MAG TPA: hypothetical protein VIN34_02825 [Candidatus Limnocylindria bacterium]|jgi:uncharacterized protein with PIN domain